MEPPNNAANPILLQSEKTSYLIDTNNKIANPTITEEFSVYGLSKTFYYIVFAVKVGLANLLLVSIKYDVFI